MPEGLDGFFRKIDIVTKPMEVLELEVVPRAGFFS
jgi:hypothetical protein